MSNFETHPTGTAEEIQLSRKLSTAISELQASWGNGIIPVEIAKAHEALIECYMKQMKESNNE